MDKAQQLAVEKRSLDALAKRGAWRKHTQCKGRIARLEAEIAAERAATAPPSGEYPGDLGAPDADKTPVSRPAARKRSGGKKTAK